MAEINKNDLISPDALKVLDDLNKTLITIDDSFRDIAKTVKGVQSTLAKGTGIKKQRQETNKLVNAEKKLKFATSEAGRELEVLKQKTAQVNKENRKLAKSSLGIKKSFGLIKNLLGAAGIVGGFQLLTSAVKASLKILKDYTTANSTLRGILNKTRKDTVELRKQQLKLGATTAFSATQVTKGQTELARLGVSMENIVKLTPSILNASIALGVDMADAAGLVAGQLNAFGLEASEGGRVADVLTKATQISAFSFEKLKTALGVVSPAAKAVGATIEETTAILSAAVDANIDAGTAATGLRNIFIDLENKGLSWDDAMKKINSSQNRLSTANELFGKRGAIVASVIADSTGKIEKNTIALNNAAGAAEAFAKEQLDNLEGDMILLTSAWEGFVLSVEKGDGIIAEVFRDMIQATTSLLTIMSNLDLAFDRMINGISGLSDENLDDFIDLGKGKETNRTFREIIDNTVAANKSMVDFSQRTIESRGVLISALRDEVGSLEDANTIVDRWFVTSLEAADGVASAMTDSAKKVGKGVSDLGKKFAKGFDEMMVQIGLSNRKFTDNALTELEDQYFGGVDEALDESLKAWEDHNKELDRIDMVRSAAALKRRQKEEAEFQKVLDDGEKALQERDKRREEAAFASVELAAETFAEIGNLRLEALQIEQEQNDAQRESELVANDEATARALLAAEGDENEKRRIQEASKIRETQINEQFDRQQARLRQKQARAEKRNALFEIAIKTAIAVASANTLIPPANIPAIILALATGAAQAAIVAARPVPAFFKGTKNAPKEGTFGEKGRELVTTKGGKSFLTPDNTTYFNDKMMEGATITPHKETEEILGSLDDARLQRPRVSLPKKVQNNSFERLEKQQIKNNQILNKILNKPVILDVVTGSGAKRIAVNAMQNIKQNESIGFGDFTVK